MMSLKSWTAWRCHHCGFVTPDLEGAKAHLTVSTNYTHWVYEHPEGNRFKPALREVHTSDAGGCYVTECDPAEEEKRITRDRLQGGGGD